ncbi:MAG: F0F1 ATP synthase subunit A [Culturomica sp.]|jgi:F-type H+-transporting ATPase subunit a|nr:F0F1 ATP synthase subunit A [Culturomica sp.]
MRIFFRYISLLAGILLLAAGTLRAGEEKTAFNPKELVFEHLENEYGWRIALPGGKHLAISLPVIVRSKKSGWHLFSSSRLTDGAGYQGFRIAPEGANAGKIVETDTDGLERRPLDLSVTKNVLAIVITAWVILLLLFPLVRWYKRDPLRAPKGFLGFLEKIIEMVYAEVIVPVLGKDARKFGPYLLTLFFFILCSNLLGLMVVFPGGANVTGNLSVTLALALCTFLVVNVSGSKKYWRDIFWPEVPSWLKFPVPLMPLIELFCALTKPFSLMIRLFANMLAGHLIMLVLVSLIFVFGAMGAAALGSSILFSVLFALFMGLLDVLICFIQAYVFMMLSTIFIALAREK